MSSNWIKGTFFVVYKSGREEKFTPKTRSDRDKLTKDLRRAKELGAVKSITFKKEK